MASASGYKLIVAPTFSSVPDGPGALDMASGWLNSMSADGWEPVSLVVHSSGGRGQRPDSVSLLGAERGNTIVLRRPGKQPVTRAKRKWRTKKKAESKGDQ